MMIFLALLFMHALCDYPLQGEFLARAKRRGAIPGIPWWIALSTHAWIHAGGVYAVTGSLTLAGLEFVAHALIDFTKCENRISFATDQALHVICKVIWALSI